MMVATATLPEELILQIVATLPVKSVGRCRCVSTRWRSLFSDPQFAKSHLRLAPKHQVLILQHPTQLETLDFDLGDTASFEKQSLLLRNVNAPFSHDHSFLEFLGACNGLVASCVFRSYVQERLFIWNPSTGFFNELPFRGHIDEQLMFGFMFGYGYLSTTDEYKVVMGVEMFSSNKGSWKRIQVPPCSVGQSCGVFSSGALHWLLYSCDQRQQVPNLYAFDLEKEEFWMMKLPDALQTLGLVRSSISYQLGVTREGCLYVMVQSEVWDSGKLASFYVVDFWVMRDYDNSDSWTKSLGVKISHQPARRDWFLSIEAISVSETSAFVRNTYVYS